METDEPIYQGFLFLPPSGKILKKSWQKKYCLLFKSSKFGIARIEIYETEAQTGQPKIITLENVIKITPKLPNIFSILTKTAEYEFGTLFDDQVEEALNNWFRAVQSVAFPDEASQISSIEEDNDLYCSTDKGVFYVKLHPSEASKRCKLSNTYYTLLITQTALQLRSEGHHKVLYTWPYCYIRRYGYKNGMFTFEAGRKCASGEGIFFLEHPHEQDIYRCLTSKMKSMKKLLGDSKLSLLDCGDIQLHAALSMEARSRSPLPPSPTALSLRSDHNSFQDSNLTSSPSSYSLSGIESPSIGKSGPKKPPRKSIISKKSSPVSMFTLNSEHEYQDVNISGSKISKYDIVEDRTEAWKTMGVENPSHTEQVNQDEDYISWGVDTLTKSLNNLRLVENNDSKFSEKHHAPAVITEPSISSDYQCYDHLNFFGSSSKLNVSSGYKQVLPPPIPPVTIPLSVNHYDEVQCIEPARSADDSHLGYGQIRKDAVSGALKEVEIKDVSKKAHVLKELKKEISKVAHQFHNEEPYAVISKPKQV